MKRRVAAGAVAALLLTTPAHAEWLSFSDPAGAFTVELPVKPTTKSDTTVTTTGSNVSLTEYLIDFDSIELVVMVADYSKSTGKLDIESGVRALAANGRALKSEKPVHLDGHDGRFARLTDQTGNEFTDQVFIIGRRLYQAITVLPAKAGDAQRAETERFNASFHFTAK